MGKWRCALSAYKGTDQTSNKQLLMDAIALPIFTYGPVDRVGVIRKLRLLPHHLWTAESPQQRQMLSFEGLYRWPEVQHARGEARTLYDPSTEQLLHRYKLPFKVHAVNPPPKKRALQVAQGARGGSPVGWRQAAWCPSPPASSSSSPCPRGRAAAAVAQGAGEGGHVEPGGRTWCQPAAQREVVRRPRDLNVQ